MNTDEYGEETINPKEVAVFNDEFNAFIAAIVSKVDYLKKTGESELHCKIRIPSNPVTHFSGKIVVGEIPESKP